MCDTDRGDTCPARLAWLESQAQVAQPARTRHRDGVLTVAPTKDPSPERQAFLRIAPRRLRDRRLMQRLVATSERKPGRSPAGV